MQLHRRLLLRAGTAVGLLAVVGRIAVQVQAQPKPRIIRITARKFTYEPAELTLKLNEAVVFQLTTQDVVMGFSVPDFATRATILPGQVTEVPLTPTKVGEFTFLCDVFCGSGHENMEGTLRVVA
jgi:cytochrome c oxidase subunit 2